MKIEPMSCAPGSVLKIGIQPRFVGEPPRERHDLRRQEREAPDAEDRARDRGQQVDEPRSGSAAERGDAYSVMNSAAIVPSGTAITTAMSATITVPASRPSTPTLAD